DVFVEHLHGLLRSAIAIVGQGFLEVFEPEAHGVKGIFYFVRDTCGDAAERGEAFADFQLGIDAFEGIEVAEGHQRADALAGCFLDGLHADVDALGTIAAVQIGFRGGFTEFVPLDVQGVVQRLASRVFASAGGASNCPAEMRSSCAVISRKGARVMPLTIAASKAETTKATATIVAEVRKLEEISLSSSAVEMIT